MHSAPAVSYPVTRSGVYGRLLLGCLSLGAVTLVAWCWQAPGPLWAQATAGLLWLAAAAAGAWHWRVAPNGLLVWDGHAWSWQQDDRQWPLQPQVRLDLQAFMLLHLQSDSAPVPRWVWPERALAPTHWRAVRRALFARAPSPEQDSTPRVQGAR